MRTDANGNPGNFTKVFNTNRGVYERTLNDGAYTLLLTNKTIKNLTTNIQSFYIHDFSQNNILIPAETAFYVKGGEINSPMRGNIIAVKTEEEVKKIASKYKANPTSWSEIIK